jgi:Mg-chelatase subunit ChlD
MRRAAAIIGVVVMLWSPIAGAQSPAPRAIVALVDVSASAEMPGLSALLEVLDLGLFARLQPNDRVRLGAVANTVTTTAWLTADPAARRDAARRVLNVPDAQRYGTSPLWDAVDAAVGALESEPGRRGVILLTDGRASGNVKGLSDVTRRAVAAGVAVSIIDVGLTIVLREEGSLPVQLRPDAPLRALAELTGGRYVRATTQRTPPRGSSILTLEAAFALIAQ